MPPEIPPMRYLTVVLLTSLAAAADAPRWSGGRAGDALDPAIQPEFAPYAWPDEPPDDCPHPRSTDLVGVRFTGRYANYTGADTWYLSWAADGHCYSAFTDGYVWTRRPLAAYTCEHCADAYKNLGVPRDFSPGALKPMHCHSNVGVNAIGMAKVVGDDPLNLGIEVLGRLPSGPNLYPCVNVVANGTWFIGSYDAFQDQGPFNGFRHARSWSQWSFADTYPWTDPQWTDDRTPTTDFFAGDRQPRRFNVPHAVVFGQDNRLSPDGKLYLSAHGAVAGGMSNWDKGDAIYLCRVDPAPAAVTDPKAYEFFAGHAADHTALWTHNVSAAQPILAWPKHLGSESVTWLPGLKKFLLISARLAESEKNLPYNLVTFWEADRITGPYRLISALRNWGPQAYFPSVPAKFIAAADPRRMWYCGSFNYAVGEQQPFGCRYAASFHELVLLTKEQPQWTPPPRSTRDIAPLATRTTGGTGDHPWVELQWNSPQRIDRIRLYDLPALGTQVLAATATFDGGDPLAWRAWLSDRAYAPGEVSFAPRTVSTLRLTITDSRGSAPAFSRIEAFATQCAAVPKIRHIP